MPTLTTDQQTALANRRLVRRDFVLVVARDPGSSPATTTNVGFWNDVGTVTVGGQDYVGAGNAGNATLASVSDMSIASLVLTLNGLNPSVVNVVRAEEISQAKVTYSIGLFDPDTRTLIGGLIQTFVGVIDDVEIKTPAGGGTSSIIFTCESASRALTIKRTDVRSDVSQKLRSATDGFYGYAGQMRETPIYFGRKDPRKKTDGGGKHGGGPVG